MGILTQTKNTVALICSVENFSMFKFDDITQGVDLSQGWWGPGPGLFKGIFRTKQSIPLQYNFCKVQSPGLSQD